MLHYGDCLDEMPKIPDSSIDLILTDPPYGTTACSWDEIIPLEPMWDQLKRLIKPNGVIVLMSSQPFTTALIHSNMKMFKYCWVWNKVTARGHLVAKKRPMAQHEDITVFYTQRPTYNPQMTLMSKPTKTLALESSRSKICGGRITGIQKYIIRTHNYPKTILTFSTPGGSKRHHPTQKPVALMKYLIKTYTNEHETVLDFAMGSGTTGVACKNLNRNFIGIELDGYYYEIAKHCIGIA